MDVITVTQSMYARESEKRRTEGENRRGQPETGEGLDGPTTVDKKRENPTRS